MSREQGCRKRNKSNSQEQKQVEEQQPVVRLANVVEQPMVVHPHDPDKGEADQEGKISRPLPQQRRAQVAILRHGNLQVEDQQRDRDGVHAVREGFDAGRFRGHGLRVGGL